MSADRVSSSVMRGRGQRWPAAAAVLVLVLMPVLLPHHLRFGPGWVLPVIGLLYLGFIVVADPTRPGARARVIRALTIALTFFLIVGGAWMTAHLIDDLINGGPSTSSARVLLSSGALVWVYNSVLFGLLYWELADGGPARRAGDSRPYPDFAFPQQMNPELAPPGWRPAFVDFLYIGFTNGLAFSPTDAMPLSAWAKLTMAVQAFISFVVLGLVIARAVNIFT
jgi:hypothetical protein